MNISAVANQKGGSVEEIMELCGISQNEAELLQVRLKSNLQNNSASRRQNNIKK